MKNIRLSMVQMESEVSDIWKNADKILRYIVSASDLSSDIVCFPEASLTGYSSSCSDDDLVTSTDPVVEEICDAAADYGISVCFGFMESYDGRRYITQALTDRGGRMHLYRKSHLGSRERDVFSPGDELPVFDVDGIKIGMHLCLEGHIPDIASVQRGKGAELIINPYASGVSKDRRRESWMKFLPARASDNGVYVAACNAVGDNGSGVEFGGGSIILDPLGNTIAEDFGGMESMITADLDRPLPRDSEESMTCISYYDRRRPDLYRL